MSGLPTYTTDVVRIQSKMKTPRHVLHTCVEAAGYYLRQLSITVTTDVKQKEGKGRTEVQSCTALLT